MPEVMFDKSIQRQAQMLANDADFDLEDHTAKQYDLLLRHVVRKGIDDDSTEFKNVAGKLFSHTYGLSNTEVRGTLARTTLLVIHTLDQNVGTVEEYSEITNGTLAKMKAGDDVNLTLMQIAFLGDTLDVPVGLLCDDFADRPADLKTQLVTCGALSSGESLEDSAVPTDSESNNDDSPDVSLLTLTPTSETKIFQPENETSDQQQEDDMEDDTESKFPEGLHEKTVVWDENFQVAKLDDISFDLTTKEFRKILVGHIRAAANDAGLSFLAIIEKGDFGKRGSGWFSQLEKGIARILSGEVEQVASLCNTSVGVLLTGHGLDPKKMLSTMRRAPNSKKVTLPTLHPKEKADWFKGRVLRKGVDMANGFDVSDLFEYAMDADNPEHDWEAIWFEKTAEGVKIQEYLSKIAKSMSGWGTVMRVCALTQLSEVLFFDD